MPPILYKRFSNPSTAWERPSQRQSNWVKPSVRRTSISTTLATRTYYTHSSGYGVARQRGAKKADVSSSRNC